MIDQLSGITEFVGRHGLPVVVCGGGIATLTLLVRQIWIPRLKARSELTTKKELAEYEREHRRAEMEVAHQAEMHKLQALERQAAIDLTNVTKDAVHSIKSSQDAIISPLNELIDAHRDWRHGWQFETVTIKRFLLESLDQLCQRGSIDSTQCEFLKRSLSEGIRE